MTINNTLTQTLLVACDQSYWGGIPNGTALAPYLDSGSNVDQFPNTMPASWNSSLGLSQWTVARRFDDPSTGFGATVYKKDNGNGTFDYIVAMQGTRGPNIQDWGGNLIYGWDKWSSGLDANNNGQALSQYLLTLPSANHINFTGQSLGGALAQYAAYQYFDARLSAGDDPDAISQSMTLTTFNGLGGVAGLDQNVEKLLKKPFNAHLLDNVTTAYYYTPNDFVHRLGGNLNAANNEYLLNFTKTDANGNLVTRDDGTPIDLGTADTHRIETGFYAGFNLAQQYPADGFPVDFTHATPKAISILPIGNLAKVGTYLAWLSNQDNALTTDAGLAPKPGRVPSPPLP